MASEHSISASGQFTCTSCDTKYTVSIAAEDDAYLQSVAGLVGSCKNTDCRSWYIVTNPAFAETSVMSGLKRLLRDLPQEKRNKTSCVADTPETQSLVKSLIDTQQLAADSRGRRPPILPIAAYVGQKREKKLSRSTVNNFKSVIQIGLETDEFGSEVLTVLPTLVAWNEQGLPVDSKKETAPAQVLELQWSPKHMGDAPMVSEDTHTSSSTAPVSVKLEANDEEYEFQLFGQTSLGFYVGRGQAAPADDTPQASFAAEPSDDIPRASFAASSSHTSAMTQPMLTARSVDYVQSFPCTSCSTPHRVKYTAGDLSIIRSMGGALVQCLNSHCREGNEVRTPLFHSKDVLAGVRSLSSASAQAAGRYPVLMPTPQSQSIVKHLVESGSLPRFNPASADDRPQLIPIAGQLNPEWPQWLKHSIQDLGQRIAVSVDSGDHHETLIPMAAYIDWTDPELQVSELESDVPNFTRGPTELTGDPGLTAPEQPTSPTSPLVRATSTMVRDQPYTIGPVDMLNMNGMGGLVDPSAAPTSSSASQARSAISSGMTWIRQGFSLRDLRRARRE